MSNVAIVGEGVIGISVALALKQTFPQMHITFLSDRKFEETCSFGPAGIFRLDHSEDERNKKWARKSFDNFAQLERQYSPAETGVKLISGFIQSDNEDLLKKQEAAMSDIVYNFHWLSERERNSLFVEPSKAAIHFTTYASEGRRYVPWLRQQLVNNYGNAVQFRHQKLNTLSELINENFTFVINCAGLNGGQLAGDDDSVYPVRGVAFEVKANFHKHFNYRDLTTFSIPMNDSVIIGTQKQENRSDLEITDEDRADIWKRYSKLHPSFQATEIVSEWSAIRPTRPTVRLELTKITNTNDKKCYIIHNYGHGGNGFTLGWGCALNVVEMISDILKNN